jgi:SAM-dependent methyltransferase
LWLCEISLETGQSILTTIIIVPRHEEPDRSGAALTMTAAQYFNIGLNDYEMGTGGCTRELARSILKLPQLSSLLNNTADAVLLDNACGSGIVSEEVLLQLEAAGGTDVQPPTIHVVDAAPNMVAIAQAKLSSMIESKRLVSAVMPGEKLDYDDSTFTHSITNMGLMFFPDPVAGANEIYRTLAPGGVAIVTTWADLGYLDNVIRPAQKSARPQDTPYEVPIPSAWFDPSHVK